MHKHSAVKRQCTPQPQTPTCPTTHRLWPNNYPHRGNPPHNSYPSLRLSISTDTHTYRPEPRTPLHFLALPPVSHRQASWSPFPNPSATPSLSSRPPRRGAPISV